MTSPFMPPDQLRSLLDSTDEAAAWLTACGLADLDRGHRNLVAIAESGVPPNLLGHIVEQLARALPGSPDADMALNNLERYFRGCSSPAGAAAAMVGDPESLGALVRVFAASQYFSDLLIAAPHTFDWLRNNWRGVRRGESLRDELASQLRTLPQGAGRLDAMRRFRHNELLRIGYRDIVGDAPLEVVTAEISTLAEAIVSAALELAIERSVARHGTPRKPDGGASEFVVIAMGKLGGGELNYSSDIDVVFLYDENGETDGRHRVSNDEFWGGVAGELVRALSTHTPRGQAYRVDLRLRPEGDRGQIVRSLAGTLAYYDTLGRTWERQALVKARPIAGSSALGRSFVEQIQPFVFRRYLSFAEIQEIQAVKRRIEAKSPQADGSPIDVKTGHGGIRDVEFVVQFLQLLNGGDLPEVREPNTLRALAALERAGCLNTQERQILEDNYRFLRNVEHRLQFMFDRQTHALPQSPDEVEKLARRLGYPAAGPRHATAAAARFLADLRTKTQLNRRILDHLLHQAFPHEAVDPETDLILDPDPDERTITAALARYPFRDPAVVYRTLVELAREPAPFLSDRRCRHFLASIAPKLLRELADTPDPDMALVNLEHVTASLGARGVLWELFSFSPPTLRLCVELCAWSQFLSQILINNPGMIDELMDSLVLNQPRSLDELRAELDELCRGAEDLQPILASFKDKEQLRIGVRDILGKDSFVVTSQSLSDIAEAVLGKIVEHEYGLLAERLGEPVLADGPRAGRPSRLVVLALGKFGGQELSYHSDLDVIFIYEGDGETRIRGRRRGWEPTTNIHFFSELGQRVIRAAGGAGPQGRLYAIDPRLRPTGRSGALAMPLDQFQRYHESGTAALWERQILTRARPVFGAVEFARDVSVAAESAAYRVAWRAEMADEIREARQRLEQSRGEQDLKRGFGGLVDIEFIVQLLQLKHGPADPQVRAPNTKLAMSRLRAAGYLDGYNHSFLHTSYEFLHRVESRLRIVHNTARDDLPDRVEDIAKLARRLGYRPQGDRTASDVFLEECDRTTLETRRTFLRMLEQEKEEGDRG